MERRPAGAGASRWFHGGGMAAWFECSSNHTNPANGQSPLAGGPLRNPPAAETAGATARQRRRAEKVTIPKKKAKLIRITASCRGLERRVTAGLGAPPNSSEMRRWTAEGLAAWLSTTTA